MEKPKSNSLAEAEQKHSTGAFGCPIAKPSIETLEFWGLVPRPKPEKRKAEKRDSREQRQA